MATNFQTQPFTTSNAAGTFNIESSGYIQGLSMDDPAIRNKLAGGVVAQTETLPMFGGIAVTNGIPNGLSLTQGTGPKALGGAVGRATSLTGALPIMGFTVFDQAHHMLGTISSPVPVAVSGMSVHFYRLGSGARIPVACDPQLAALQGGLESQPVSWDFVSQRVVPYVAAYGNDAITAASYNSSTGQITYTTAAAHGLVATNDVSITGMTPIGYNGSFTCLAGTTGSTIVVASATNPGTATGFGQVAGGGGALPVRILGIDPTNCMTVNLDPVSGNVTWNRNGACALLLI